MHTEELPCWHQGDGPGRHPLAPCDGLPRIRKSPPPVCPICFEELGAEVGGPVRSLRCGHAFHAACVEKWLTRRSGNGDCPNCRQPVMPTTAERQSEAAAAAAVAAAGAQSVVATVTPPTVTPTAIQGTAAQQAQTPNPPDERSPLLFARFSERPQLQLPATARWGDG